MTRSFLLSIMCVVAAAAGARAQEAPPPAPDTAQSSVVTPAPGGAAYVPITTKQRLAWIGSDLFSVRSSVETGALATIWQSAWDVPSEWGRTWSGAGKRYLAREADVALSDSLEAGLGSIWGEDPRYIRAPPGSFKSRVGWALKTVVLAPRPDGRLAPAWGRYAGNTVNNLIENTYLPRSMTTPGQTVWRSVEGLLSRAGYNAWQEFWPDVKKHLHR